MLTCTLDMISPFVFSEDAPPQSITARLDHPQLGEGGTQALGRALAGERSLESAGLGRRI